MKEFKVTSEEFTKLVGPNGERFTSEAEYRLVKKGEYYLGDDGKSCFWNEYGKTISFFIVLTRAKTAREWLSEWDAPGWREEALAYADEVQCKSLRHAIVDCLPDWGSLPSGWDMWNAVRIAVVNGTPIPPHPSTVKKEPKIERVPVVADKYGWLNAKLGEGDISIQNWSALADFRGFVFVLLDGRELLGRSETLLWGAPDEPAQFDNERTAFYSHPLRPSFVEVEQ